MGSKRASRSRSWSARQNRDPYVKKARESDYRSRAAFKLQQLDQKERIIRAGMSVVDLGAAPGSWSQYAAAKVGSTGVVVAVDRLDMGDIPGVAGIKGDFLDDAVVGRIDQVLAGRPADLVISDLAPNLTGVSSVDQSAMEVLVLAAMRFALRHIGQKGVFVAKFFEGEQADSLRQRVEKAFEVVRVRKPDASRAKSTEAYLVARQPLGGEGVCVS